MVKRFSVHRTLPGCATRNLRLIFLANSQKDANNEQCFRDVFWVVFTKDISRDLHCSIFSMIFPVAHLAGALRQLPSRRRLFLTLVLSEHGDLCTVLCIVIPKKIEVGRIPCGKLDFSGITILYGDMVEVKSGYSGSITSNDRPYDEMYWDRCKRR